MGNRAEGTAVVAAVLHLQVGTGAFVVRSEPYGIKHRRGQQFGVSEDVGDENLGWRFRRQARNRNEVRARRNACNGVMPTRTDYDFRQLMLVGIADHAAYSRKGRN